MKDNKALILIGSILCIFVMAYMFAVTFWDIPTNNINTSHIIIGYMSGVITTIVGYWFGGSLKPIGADSWQKTSGPGTDTTSGSGDGDGTPNDPEIQEGDEPIGNTRIEDEN